MPIVAPVKAIRISPLYTLKSTKPFDLAIGYFGQLFIFISSSISPILNTGYPSSEYSELLNAKPLCKELANFIFLNSQFSGI